MRNALFILRWPVQAIFFSSSKELISESERAVCLDGTLGNERASEGLRFFAEEDKSAFAEKNISLIASQCRKPKTNGHFSFFTIRIMGNGEGCIFPTRLRKFQPTFDFCKVRK
jgi:hypothetical protein